MTKKELRKYYIEKRKQLGHAEKSRLDDLLLIQLQQCELPFIRSLFVYWPITEYNEPDTHLFTDYLEFCNPGVQLLYPRLQENTNEMEAVPVNEDTAFRKGKFGVYEPVAEESADPASIDMSILPLLAFDTNGYRLGYGKGYYDRFLQVCRKDLLKIGFSYFDPVERIPEKHEFDVPLSHCITPQSIYVF